MNPLPYIDGFVLPIAKDKLDAYQKTAAKAATIWKDHGALEYYECAADDLTAKDMVSFDQLASAGPDETVIFAFAIYPSREVRDAANEKIMSDPRIAELCEEAGRTFDCKRMAFGGFRTIVRA